MRICIVEQRYPPRSSGGASYYAKRSADALAQQGHEVTVITTKPYDGFSSLKPTERIDGDVEVIEFVPLNVYDCYRADEVPLILKPFFYLVNLWNPHHYLFIRGVIKARRPDVVHIHSIDGLSLSLFDAVEGLGIPSIITLHAFALLCPRVTLIRGDERICSAPHFLCAIYRALRRIVLDSKPAMVLSPSHFVLDTFSDAGFFDDCKKIKVPLLISSSPHDKTTKERREPKERFDILYVGRLGYHKGIHILIDVFKNLPHSNAFLHIVGWGDYEGYLKEISQDDKRIRFYGRIPANDVHTFYASADVTVVPSICFENSPYVIYESFSMGTPVIGSRIGGIPELIDEGKNGFLFDPGNANDLETILVSLIEERTDMDLLRHNAKRSSLKYGMEDHVQKLEEIYIEAIERRRDESRHSCS